MLASHSCEAEDVTACLTRRERKIYFEKLDVAAIQCNLTLIPRPGQRAEVDPVCPTCCTQRDTAQCRYKHCNFAAGMQL